MLISVASCAAVVVALIGLLLLWSNPDRIVNRLICGFSFYWALWLACLHVSLYMHLGVLGIRISCAIGAWAPMYFWVIGEVIGGKWDVTSRRWLGVAARWALVTAGLTAVCFTSFFISTTYGDAAGPTLVPAFPGGPLVRPIHHAYGFGYYLYIAVLCLNYGVVLYRTHANSQQLHGARKLELQIWLFGGCGTVLTIIGAMGLNALTHNRIYIQLQPLFVLAFYGGTAYAITTHRIFDAHQLLRVCVNKSILMALVVGVAYGTFILLRQFLPDLAALLPSIVISLACAAAVKGWLDRRFEFYPHDSAARQAAYAVAHNETRVENMETAFLAILRGWGQTEQALVLTGAGGKSAGNDDDLTPDERVGNAMRQLRWVTPERLARERHGPQHEILGQFLAEHRLGAAVFSETPTLHVVVGVGVPASRRAFTYPQVTQLQELAAIMQGALERTLMVLKIQHTEQLATVGLLGASLAHEIRNPLVSVKAIVQLLPSRYQEAEFREKFFRLISDEVVRIDRLTEQLLDLASPHVYKARPLELHSLLKSSLELVAPRAADKRVEIISEFAASPDSAYTDPAAVTQALLNLCFNAIQALDARPTDRWLRVSTRNTVGGVELAVADNGPGITPEMRIRLFKPFQTSKSSGFGLGLTVCRDILASLHAPITVDKPAPGLGATFRITFPCPP